MKLPKELEAKRDEKADSYSSGAKDWPAHEFQHIRYIIDGYEIGINEYKEQCEKLAKALESVTGHGAEAIARKALKTYKEFKGE